MSDNNFNGLSLESFWPYKVAVLADLVSRHTLEIARRHGDMNLSQWRVLACIAEQPGRSSAQVVALTPMDKTIVSRAVARLIEKGLARKTADVKDKRRAQLYLTDTGDAQYRLIAAELQSAINALPPAPDFLRDMQVYIEGLRGLLPSKPQ